MDPKQNIDPIAARLDETLRSPAIPPQIRDWGKRLLDHLRRPVRIVVTGVPGSGKSSLINMMLSQNVLGASAGIPVIDIAYGPEPRVLFELEDGRSVESPGLLADFRVPERVIRARQELPDPSLRGQCYRELGLGQAPEIGRRILAAAMKDADIVLWCTNSFGEIEQSLWRAVPDEVKDHSFLVVTRADRQMMWGVLSKTIATLEPVVSEEFLGLYPVATLQGLSALTAGSEPDMALWHSSGGKSLCAEIATQVASGRAADLDQAQAFLAQFADAAARAEAAPRPAPAAPAQPAPVAAPATDRADSAVAQAIVPGPINMAATAAGGMVAASSQPGGTAATDVLDNAVQILTRSGRDLLREIAGDDAVDTDAVLERCAATIGALSLHFQDSLTDDPALQLAQDNVREGEEMLMLFQLERGEDAALDAVTLLLQLRKESAMRETA
ncbi:MAG: hypothetical protein R3D85_11925 [Paracoccaceae bacterium]